MPAWIYELSFHPVREILEEAQKELEVIPCDEQGRCLFKDMPTANMEVLTMILNTRGSQGWELVQINFSNQELICVWKKEKP
jgi:hypothetical protein